MTELFSQRVSVPDDVLMRELDGESVILDLASENYYGLDDIGTRMWQLLISSQTVQETYDAMLMEYDVEPQQLRQDMQDLITQLVSSDLLRLETDPEKAESSV